MKARLIQFVNVALLLAAGRLFAADPTNAVTSTESTPASSRTSTPASTPAPVATNDFTKLDFPSFQIISQRNIFDPNRRTRSRISIGPAPRSVQVDYFTLRGTSSYDDQNIAVFVGNGSQYNKTATTRDTIAGYKIAEIAFDHVKLAATSNLTFNLPVGGQMKRSDNGPWSMTDVADYSSDSVRPPTATTDEKPAASGKPAAGADDIIQRLMRKREQEK